MARLALGLVCVLLLASCVQGCGFLDIKCKVKKFIDEESSKVIGQAKQAFEQAMDYLFDKDISPLLDKVEAAIDAGIDKVDKDVNDTINHIESAIQEIIHDAAQTANALASNVTRDIEQIIGKAASAVEQVEKMFYRDASRLLAKINQIVQKVQCMETSGAKQLQDGIYKLLKSLDPYYRFTSCWRGLGFKFTTSLLDLTDIQLYNFQKECTLLNKITPHTPIKGPGGILETYAQGQLYAAEYFCIGETANAPDFQDVLTKEWLWWGVQYNTWNAFRETSKNLTHFEAGQDSTVQQLKDDPACGTPVECYAQAIEALKEAEQKILGLQTSLSDLNQTVKQVVSNQTRINADQAQVNAILKANTSANSQAVSVNTKSIATNKNAIASNAKRSISRCSCEKVTGYVCPYPMVSVGLFLSPTATYCCNLCTGQTEDAAAYALANPWQGRKNVPQDLPDDSL